MIKKITRPVVLLVCLAVLLAGAGGSYAYFTAEQRSHSVITSAGVDVSVLEWADEEETVPFPEEGITDVYPGAEVVKIVEVEAREADCWVRVKVTERVTFRDGTVLEGDPDNLIEEDFQTAGWTYKDGWYYCSRPLTKGNVTQPLFSRVRFLETLGNEYQGATATVEITAQAVQSANNGTSALDAAGWPAE